MKPAAFAYARARSVEHAVELLGRDGARLLAGGQSLLATLAMRLSAPSLLVDLNEVAGLDSIARKDGMLEIGARVRHADAERSDLVAKHAPLIARAIPHIGHPAIRNRGTVGGSVAFADPAAELPACLLALGGEMEIVGPAGRRALPADEFFRGLYETALSPRDVLTAVRVPVARAGQRFGFAELARRHGDYALVGLAAATTADGAGRAEVRLAWFAAGATALRTRKAELALASRDVEAAVAALADELDPPDDVHASGTMRKHLAGVLLRRVAAQLLGPEP